MPNNLVRKQAYQGVPSFLVKTEDEIVRNWSQQTPPLVSVCCATFNHVAYIETAIQSFLSQETTFPFEVIIRDDASIDGTTKIVLQYQKKYPRIIRAEINVENKFVKGERAAQVWPLLAKGQYIAMCEGDDFWISTSKLQTQVEALEKNKDMGFCFHQSATFENNQIKDSVYSYESRAYSLAEFVLADFHFIQTNTLMFRKSTIDERLIAFLRNISVADFFLRFYSGRNGAICINEQMGCYRVLSTGSWSSRLGNAENLKKYFIHYFGDLDRFDQLLDLKYTHLIAQYNVKLLDAVVRSNLKVLDKMKIVFSKLNKLSLVDVARLIVIAVLKNRYLRALKC